MSCASPALTDVPVRDHPLLTESVARLCWRYGLPTVMSMLVTGIYVAIDGMFVGHYLGEQGLAGMMLAYPVGAVLYAVGAMIGMGAAALVSIRQGEGRVEQARQLLGNAFTLCLLTGAFFALVGTSLGRPILAALGAEGAVLNSAERYLFWYFALGIFPIISIAFTALLRNDGRPGFVTWVLILGGVLNIILDWLFIVVWPYGLAGAAVATMLSQAVTGLLCLQHFFTNKTQLGINWQQMQLRWAHCSNICRVGLPSLLMNLYLSLVLTMHNMAFLWVGGAIYVAAYSVVSYSEALFYLIFEGIAFGVQPILSFNAGAGRYDRVLQARRIGFGATLVIAVLGMAFIYSRPDWLVYLFAGDNATLTPVAETGMLLYFWGLPMGGLLLVGASFCQAVNRSYEASVLTGTKLVVIMLMLWLLGYWLGTTGVWLALSVSSTILALWMGLALRRIDRQHNGLNPYQPA
ncbi:multidrug transporter MatE [Shewanella sp. NFH-SH190041]|uniref:MATE family efflux transporter n=1 Tax=Shewanella sp. NFH-SH190041 TaxID=2950245 RepID=UPI0021C30A67|nr:MATE family efflux transporter [Shewanella sp. NFH-SH190041]BDM65250.1 multidrug transporter MatE [Shewanella sp. NFH-SH190041]